MTESKHWKEHVVIQGRPDLVSGKVEDVQRKPTDKEDSHHGDEEPASPESQHPDSYHSHPRLPLHPLDVRPPLVVHLHGAVLLQSVPQLGVDQSVSNPSLLEKYLIKYFVVLWNSFIVFVSNSIWTFNISKPSGSFLKTIKLSQKVLGLNTHRYEWKEKLDGCYWGGINL